MLFYIISNYEFIQPCNLIYTKTNVIRSKVYNRLVNIDRPVFFMLSQSPSSIKNKYQIQFCDSDLTLKLTLPRACPSFRRVGLSALHGHMDLVACRWSVSLYLSRRKPPRLSDFIIDASDRFCSIYNGFHRDCDVNVSGKKIL